MQETTEAIRNYLIKNNSAASPELSDTDSLLEADLIDSLSMLGLIGFLESEFKIKVQDDDVLPENFESVLRIAEMVNRKKS